MMKSPTGIQRILITAFVLETVMATYALLLPSFAKLTSVLHSIAGAVIACCLLWIPAKGNEIKINGPFFQSKHNQYRLLFMGIGLLVICRFSIQWMNDDPLNYVNADMLPIIKTMCQRFLSGAWSHVYDPIPEIWNGIHPIYLPAMWLPFNIPSLLHIDIRWVTIGSLFIVSCIFLWKLNPAKRYTWLICLCAFLLFWWILAVEESGLIPYTEEGIVILYYVLLCLALQQRNVWLIGIATSLCVLSRYSLIGWLPAMVIYFVYLKQWRNLLRFALAGVICLVLLMLLPFGWDRFVTLAKLPGEYIAFTQRVWSYAPHVFEESLGWAKFFGPTRIYLQHQLLVYSSFVVPVVSILFFLRVQKARNFPAHNIPLAVLKLTLVVFYTLVDVPYLYLFYTSSFVSLIGVTYFMRRSAE
jgi:hypothetical protein